MQSVLLIAAAYGAFRIRRRVVMMALGAEMTLFTLSNLVYLIRDGVETRIETGYEGSTLTLIILLTGFLVRAAILAQMASSPGAALQDGTETKRLPFSGRAVTPPGSAADR